MRIRPPEFETSICNAKYHVSLASHFDSFADSLGAAGLGETPIARSVLGKCFYLVTLAMSLFDLQDVRIAIGSIATLDLPMVVDLIGIYGLKGPYFTLTTNNWFLQALSVIPRGSWGDVARRSYHDPMGKSGIVIPEPQWDQLLTALTQLLLHQNAIVSISYSALLLNPRQRCYHQLFSQRYANNQLLIANTYIKTTTYNFPAMQNALSGQQQCVRQQLQHPTKA
ncbi:plasma membrane ATPase 1-like [Dorcoceras hygrometricum]|uniref:Plasma membrane ATPase 1-like n=1 Tax=Dorcoceras hygrometricum TaxID=472368 RepID=A0A2Z7A246_9LAMI|nr:plasma membrane ATPase 1-like [Dorcoceras hygrometricum]